MIKFTNLRTKALALVAMMAFSVGSVFGQATLFEGAVTGAPKMLQWNNQTKIEAPVNNGAIAQGVKATFSGSPDGPLFVPVSPAVGLSATVPTTNPNLSSMWIGADGKSLNLFASDQNRAAITFDISTKYLKNVKDLQILLDANTFGGTANKTVNWNMHLSVYNLDGTLVDYDDIYQGAGLGSWERVRIGGYMGHWEWVWNPFVATDMTMWYENIYNTSMGEETIKLFQIANDVIEDHPFIPNSLDNKIIRITLISDRPAAPAGVEILTAPAATVVKSLTIASSEPGMTLSRAVDYNGDNTFDAGMGYVINKPENKLTLTQTGLSLPVTATAKVTAPAGFLVEGNTVAQAPTVAFATNPVSPEYQFAPTIINTFTGTFTAEAENFKNAIDPLSPIVALTATSLAVNGNSVPELYLEKDKLTFIEGGANQNVQIWGKNIPLANQGDLDYVGGFFLDQDWSALAGSYVYNDFDIDQAKYGVIDHIASNKLIVSFGTYFNNVDAKSAVNLVISQNYNVPNAFGPSTSFNGKQEKNFVNPNDELVPFPTVLVVGNVGAVWFEYDGGEGTAPKIVGDIATAFYAPYDANLLPEQQAVSRTKTFYLKGAKVKTNSSDNAVFEISLDKMGTHDWDGHIAFRYSIDNGVTWKPAFTPSILTVKLLTAQDIKDFQEIGKPILVQFKPDCDGFELEDMGDYNGPVPMAMETEDLYLWRPHYNFLKAVQTNTEGRAAAFAKVFGDTRANLENTIHNWQFVDVMQNSVQAFWSGFFLTKSDFRKDYGNTFFTTTCGEQNNPLNQGEFFITGYNLTDSVDVTVYKDALPVYKDAFKYTIIPVDGFGTVDGMSIVPNAYGEVAARVVVEFLPKDKGDRRNVNDMVTVDYDGRTVVHEGYRSWDPNFNYVDILFNHPEQDLFIYSPYDYPDASLCGRVYKPTFEAVEVENMTADINEDSTQSFTFTASDLDKTLKNVTLALANNTASPYSIISDEVLPIDDNGNVSGTVTVKFAPTPENKCNNLNSIVYTYGDCATVAVDESEIAGTTIVGQPTFQAFQAGDIQGDRADLTITPAVGGENYMVGIGVLKYGKTTNSIFMSEVYAANDKIYVELFNGTGEELNGKIISAETPNYYLQIFKSGVTAAIDTIILDETDEALWAPYGIEVKSIDFDMDGSHNYKLVLKQGQITLDVYEFTGDISHKTRKDDLAPAAYKTSIFTESDWTTAGGWHTSLNALTQEALYASMFNEDHTTNYSEELPKAKFYEFFDSERVEQQYYGFVKGVSVNKLKKNVTYTAYAYTLPACEGVKVVGNHDTKLVPCSDSEIVNNGDPMEGVTFGYFTGIDQVEVAKNIYAANGKIYVAGATEGVTIFNALGMQVKAASIEEAAAGIDVANGIYMVKSGDKTAKVLVNK